MVSGAEIAGPCMDRLRQSLQDLGRVVVAFSGGADSAFLARVAHDTLGADRVHVVTAVSPSLAGDERDDAAALADEWGLRWSEVETHEMADAAYRMNDPDRCGRCKDALMDVPLPIARFEAATVVLGVNVDDRADHRPGKTVAAERGASFPMVEAGLTKADDNLPKRLLNEPHTEGPSAGVTVDLDAMLPVYYRERGWDEEGVPTEEKLAALGLASM